MERMLIIMISYSVSANDPSDNTEIINTKIHFIAAAHLLHLGLFLLYIQG